MSIERQAGSGTGRNILIVDDEEIICRLITRIIGTLAPTIDVVSAPDGFAALKEFTQKPFDLVMTDYDMPGMNGLDLAKKVHRLSPQTRIALMTGGNFPHHNSAASLEFDDYLSKPFEPAQIWDLINVYM